jgi:glycosyltransferase involved in cell wall biosynthesis
LPATIESVIAQTFLNWEMLIIDDVSTDNSFQIASRFAKRDPRIKVFQLERNSGPAVARNLGIRLSKGRFISFLDSDDLWLPYKLEKQLDFMKTKGIPFSFSSYQKIDEKGHLGGVIFVPTKVNYHKVLKTCIIGCLTAIYDSTHLGKMEMPDSITGKEDFMLWLKILKQEKFGYGIQEVLALYREHGTSVSSNKIKAAKKQWCIYRNLEKLDFFKSCFYFFHYAIHGFFKKIK